MKKIIILFSLVFLFFGYGNNVLVLAEEIIDLTPPTGTILINGGALFTNNREVVLTLSATDDISEVNEMKIANHNSYHDWEPYSTEKNWILTEGDGSKTVRVKFKDQVGNETGTGLPASIILDTAAPTITIIGDSEVNLKVGDTYTDLGVTALDNTDGDITESVIVGGTYVDTSVEGEFSITYDVADSAGNNAVQVVRTINVSTNSENPSPTLASISVTKPATKLEYKIGEVLDITGLEVTGVYSDSSTKVELITTDSVTGFDNSIVASGQILTITIGGFSTNYSVNISKNDNGSSGDDADDNILIEEDVKVPSSCEVKDTDGVTHVFTDEDSSGNFLAICALAEALEEGIIDELNLKNDSSFGLYVENINDIEISNTEYWAIWLNDKYTDCGVGCQSVSDGDKLSLILTDWMTETESSKVFLSINTPSNETRNSSGGGSNNLKGFSVPEALDFLLENKERASVFVYDWIAMSTAGGSNSDLKSALVDYLKSNPINSNIITENERRAMALMSLDISPYDGTEINYIKKITDSFNGTELKDDSLSDFNDDIFGLIVLQKVGYDENDEMISKIISYILSKQSDDGSWGSVDMTGAAIMALWKFENVDGVKKAISGAQKYLVESQNDDGGFENVSSASWAIQALSLDDSYDDEIKDGIEYLAGNQENDGGLNGVDMSNRIWATAYAIPAALELSWIDIMSEFDKSEKLESEELIIEVPTQLKIKPEIKPLGEVVKKDIKKVVALETSEEDANEIIKEEKIENSPDINLLASAGNIESKFTQDKNAFIVVLIAIFLLGFVILKKV